MESNFIRERVVVREQLITKNLGRRKNRPVIEVEDEPSPIQKKIQPESVTIFEEVINERLRQDLVDVSKTVDNICQTIADYLKVKSALAIFKKNTKNVRLQTNIGCNFYAQCHVEDLSKVYICVGQDYFLHMDLHEAIKMVEFKEKQWMKELDRLQEKSSKIKAYIKIALEAMGRLYDMDKEKLNC